MRADRLVSLIMLLQSRGKMSARELARELEVAPRTIYRDMQALSSAGIPVYMERGSSGGCCLVEGYHSDLTGLTADEIQALFLFSTPGILEEIPIGKHLRAAIRKLAAAPRNSPVLPPAILLDWSGEKEPVETVPFLDVLYHAITERHYVNLSYLMINQVMTSQMARPMGLVAQSGRWFLVTKGNYKANHYRLDEFLAVDVLDECFERDEEFNLEIFWANVKAQAQAINRSYMVQVRISGELAPYFMRIYPYVMEEGDSTEETRILELYFPSYFEARRVLLGWGGAVEVLSPPELRWGIEDFAHQIILRYGA